MTNGSWLKENLAIYVINEVAKSRGCEWSCTW